ncbi:MAG: hypothetical protein HC785_20615 [Calothrix sp. CSU_2_0]|nr:hypothetical protein [Calothrix sp. CSU_2_0]
MSGQAGLISTHVYHSFRWRCVNFGHWRSLEDFTAIQTLLFLIFLQKCSIWQITSTRRHYTKSFLQLEKATVLR